MSRNVHFASFVRSTLAACVEMRIADRLEGLARKVLISVQPEESFDRCSFAN